MKIRFALSVGLGAPDAEALAALVADAEARGFDGLWFSDVPLLPATDPFLAVAFAAARSQRLKRRRRQHCRSSARRVRRRAQDSSRPAAVRRAKADPAGVVPRGAASAGSAG